METTHQSHRSGGRKQVAEKPSIRICEENTVALKKVNKSIEHLLAKLPLNTQKEVVEINRLIEEQQRLICVRLKGHCPVRIETLNENERYRANHLNRRFREAQRNGKIRNAGIF